eukprot:TRINITY_DN9933_c0_g3_i2.p1 TRINITY_DN9933_c0_g3~~TRINITY_DN9933_c0_g3_i2.p1  ORF type:complete len:211 (+),score=17.64 TRINITY_DN9933_c0_g3_i2:78-635(+)
MLEHLPFWALVVLVSSYLFVRWRRALARRAPAPDWGYVHDSTIWPDGAWRPTEGAPDEVVLEFRERLRAHQDRVTVRRLRRELARTRQERDEATQRLQEATEAKFQIARERDNVLAARDEEARTRSRLQHRHRWSLRTASTKVKYQQWWASYARCGPSKPSTSPQSATRAQRKRRKRSCGRPVRA